LDPALLPNNGHSQWVLGSDVEAQKVGKPLGSIWTAYVTMSVARVNEEAQVRLQLLGFDVIFQ
jgi:hypothetical protein